MHDGALIQAVPIRTQQQGTAVRVLRVYGEAFSVPARKATMVKSSYSATRSLS